MSVCAELRSAIHRAQVAKDELDSTLALAMESVVYPPADPDVIPSEELAALSRELCVSLSKSRVVG